MQDEELLKLYEPRKEKYYDPEYHLLVQDIIYTTYYEAEPDMLEPVQIVKPTQFKHKAVKLPIELKGEFIDAFEMHLRIVRKLSQNTLTKYMSCFRKIMYQDELLLMWKYIKNHAVNVLI